MEFSRLEYWSGLPFPSPGDLPELGTEPVSSALQADSLLTELPMQGARVQSLVRELDSTFAVVQLLSCV